MFFVLLLVVVVFLMYYSNDSKNKIIRWLGAVIPPMFMLLFVYIPMDLITSLFWLTAFALFVYSIYKIVKAFSRIIYAKIKAIKLDVNTELFKIIRPALYIATLTLAKNTVHSSVAAANMAAIDLAIKMKMYVQDNGACEASLEGWANAENMRAATLTKEFGNFGTTYPVFYTCDINSREFNLWVDIDQDSSFSIAYLKNGNLEATYGHFSHPIKVIVDGSTNLADLASRKIANKE
jgi:hypothetical protein